MKRNLFDNHLINNYYLIYITLYGVPMALVIACPTCKKETAYGPGNPFRPFCSERCRMIDLGTWLEEGFSIASENDAEIAESSST